MKKIIFVISAIMIVFALCGCKNETETKITEQEQVLHETVIAESVTYADTDENVIETASADQNMSAETAGKNEGNLESDNPTERENESSEQITVTDEETITEESAREYELPIG